MVIAAIKSDPQLKAPTSAKWIGMGQTVIVAGYQIKCGMLYVGSELPAIRAGGGTDPSAIDPNLEVARTRPDRAGNNMSYYPSYSKISPDCRAAYLEWLEAGRSGSNVYIGYVFLFYYGLERRVLNDLYQLSTTERHQELNLIVAEIERLLGLYGANLSFRGYARGFLDICSLLRSPTPNANISPRLRSEIAFGFFAADQKPIPAEWVLSWYVHSRSAKILSGLKRCAVEFQQLFFCRYQQQFGAGLMLKPGRTKLKVAYHTASASFDGPIGLEVGLPDVMGSASVQRLGALADQCLEALIPFSRWLKSHPGQRGTVSAMAYLPLELLELEQEHSKNCQRWLEGCLTEGSQLALVSLAELVRVLRPSWRELGGKESQIALGRGLEIYGYGIEPDIRFGGKFSVSEAVLFRFPSGKLEPPSSSLIRAILWVDLLAWVDKGQVEEGLIQLQKAVDLSPQGWMRLQARRIWTETIDLTWREVKVGIEAVDPQSRREVAAGLIGVCGRRQITPNLLQRLNKVYLASGLDPNSLYDDLHNGTELKLQSVAEVVVVRPAGAPVLGFALPSLTPPQSLGLDLQQIELKRAESAAVVAVLGEIFVEEELVGVGVHSGTTSGLESIYRSLLQQLQVRSVWTRQELEQLTDSLGLMLDGALEILNEAALDKCEMTLTLGENPIKVNGEVIEALLQDD